MMPFFSACDEKAIAPDSGDIPIEMDKRYIHFDAGIKTRGIMEGTALYDDFAVLGYHYTTSWANENIFAVPNVFPYNNNQNPSKVVSYNENTGLFEYTPLQPWTSDKYSFFAFYPSSNNSITLFDANRAKQGHPYIKYELVSGNDPANMLDIMTASEIDTDVNNSTVGLHMIHRLSAVDLSIRNYEKYNDQYEVEVLISSLQLTFTKMNTSVTIYLDPSIPSVPQTRSGSNLRTYNIVGSGTGYSSSNPLILPYNPDEKIVVKKNDTNKTPLTLLLIPQVDLDKEGYLEGKMSISYKKRYKSGSTYYYLRTSNRYSPTTNQNASYTTFSSSPSFTFDRQLEEGRRYDIVVNFASDDVVIVVDPIADWNTIDVDHEFI